MGKVLITGMAASQHSMTLATRSRTFASTLKTQLEAQGHTVFIVAPQITWTKHDLRHYDAVLVGMAPVLSLAANSAYGALSIVEQLWNDRRLTLFVDAPLPGQILASARHVVRNPDSLIKTLFIKRPGYRNMLEPGTYERIYRMVDILATQAWPEIIYPALPWPNDDIAEYFPYNLGINFDLAYIEEPRDQTVSPLPRWVSSVKSSKWLDRTANLVTYPVEPARKNKGSTDKDVRQAMGSSIGLLLSPERTGHVWWSTRVAQALSEGVPIATEWREAAVTGPSWSVLPAQLESMNDSERRAYALMQREEYIESLPGLDFSRRLLENRLGLNQDKENHD